MVLEKPLEPPGHHPVDFRLRIALPEGIEEGQTVNDIPKGAGLNDEDLGFGEIHVEDLFIRRLRRWD